MPAVADAENTHRHADVQIVMAGREDVLAGRRRLDRHRRLERRIEEHRLEARQKLIERLKDPAMRARIRKEMEDSLGRVE